MGLLRRDLPVPPPTVSPSPKASGVQLQRNRELYRKDWERDRDEELIERRAVLKVLRWVVFVIAVVAVVSVCLVLMLHLTAYE